MNKTVNNLNLVCMLSNRYMTIKEIGDHFRVSDRTVKRWLADIRASDVTLLCDQAGAATAALYGVKVEGAGLRLQTSWDRLVREYAHERTAVLVLCEYCRKNKKLSPIPLDRPDCDRCGRAVVIERFLQK